MHIPHPHDMLCPQHGTWYFLHGSISGFQFCAVLAPHCELNFWVDFHCWVSNVWFEKHRQNFALTRWEKIYNRSQSNILDLIRRHLSQFESEVSFGNFIGTKMHVLRLRLASFFSSWQSAWHQTAWRNRSDTLHFNVRFRQFSVIFIVAAYFPAAHGFVSG